MNEIQSFDLKFNKYLVLIFGISAIFLFTIGMILHNIDIIYYGYIPLVSECICAFTYNN